MNIENSLRLHRSGRITRCHATPELPGQSLAAHQWGVSMILCEVFDDVRIDEIIAALTHDVGEIATGDIFGPFKNQIGKDLPEAAKYIEDFEKAARHEIVGRIEIDEIQAKRVHFADKMEFAILAITNARPGRSREKIVHDALGNVERAIEKMENREDADRAKKYLSAWVEDWETRQ